MAAVALLPARKAGIGEELVISGISVGGATACTNPLDVVKTRLQLHTGRSHGAAKGVLRTTADIVREEGVLKLWSGLTPAVARGFVYGGMRLGLYAPCRDALSGLGGDGQAQASVGVKVASGILSGAIAAGATSPTELVKTRLQTKSAHKPAGAWEVMRQVVQQDGVQGLWRGALPSMVRAALLTASQVATYDSCKRYVSAATGWGDTLSTHLAASCIAGLVTTTVTNPADVVKTRMFVQGGAVKRGIIGTTVDVLQGDGIRGFAKGWSASYARLGPQTVIIFLINETLRGRLGLQGL